MYHSPSGPKCTATSPFTVGTIGIWSLLHQCKPTHCRHICHLIPTVPMQAHPLKAQLPIHRDLCACMSESYQIKQTAPCCATIMHLQGKHCAQGLALTASLLHKRHPVVLTAQPGASSISSLLCRHIVSEGGLCIPGVDQCRACCTSAALRPRQTGGEE